MKLRIYDMFNYPILDKIINVIKFRVDYDDGSFLNGELTVTAEKKLSRYIARGMILNKLNTQN